jgi:methionine synthase II (cobalamin-independent)
MISGLATGIGSFPYLEAKEALDLIFQYTPEIPFWPELPKRNLKEGMVAQYSENLPCLKVTAKGIESFTQAKQQELELFYERLIANDLEYFKISKDYALGLHEFSKELEKRDLKDVEYIKCHITGPFTFGASIKDQNGVALLHDPIFMQAIIKGLSLKALWQIKHFQRFGKKIIIFIDEPYLACFGSAYTPINKEEVIKGLGELTESIASDTVLTGIHCCGNTDWSIFTDLKSLDIISFDAFSFLDRFILYADEIRRFISRQGIICWGIVPTEQFNQLENSKILVEKIIQGVNSLVDKGLSEELLKKNLFLSPSCGLGSLASDQPEKIFQTLAETSNILRRIL